MDWSEPLLPLWQTYALYCRMCDYGTVSEADIRVLTGSIEFTSPLMIGRTLNLLHELRLVDHDEVFTVIGDRVDEDMFRARLTTYLERVVSDTALVDTVFRMEGIYGSADDGSLLYWKSFVAKDHRALLPLLLEAGMLRQDSSRRTLLLPSSGVIARHFVELSADKIKQLSLSHLLADLERKRLLGLKAEEAALRYERAQLRRQGDMREPQRISDLFVNAGYDIVSYLSPDSAQPDKCIEVKAMTASGHFFISRNELLVAEKKGAAYFLYLVQIDEDDRHAADIRIITDPHATLMHDEVEGWLRTVESYRFERT